MGKKLKAEFLFSRDHTYRVIYIHYRILFCLTHTEQHSQETTTSTEMAATYTIAGKVIPSHYLSIATLSLVTLLILPNPFKTVPVKQPKIEGSSPEETAFIKKYIEEHEPKKEGPN